MKVEINYISRPVTYVGTAKCINMNANNSNNHNKETIDLTDDFLLFLKHGEGTLHCHSTSPSTLLYSGAFYLDIPTG